MKECFFVSSPDFQHAIFSLFVNRGEINKACCTLHPIQPCSNTHFSSSLTFLNPKKCKINRKETRLGSPPRFNIMYSKHSYLIKSDKHQPICPASIDCPAPAWFDRRTRGVAEQLFILFVSSLLRLLLSHIIRRVLEPRLPTRLTNETALLD